MYNIIFGAMCVETQLKAMGQLNIKQTGELIQLLEMYGSEELHGLLKMIKEIAGYGNRPNIGSEDDSRNYQG